MSELSADSGLSVHLSTVLIGLHWLYDTPQPDEAVVPQQDRGQELMSAGGWRFSFIPAGPSGVPVIVVDSSCSPQRLSQVDVDELAGHVDDFGETVRRARLSGPQGILELDRPAHPSLLCAVDRAGWRGATDAAGDVLAIGITEVQQRALKNPSVEFALAGLWPMRPAEPSDQRSPIRSQRTRRGGAGGRSSKSPQSLWLRSPGCPEGRSIC
ncbi:MAG: hypothetical protein WCE30_24100 [Mycobacterium sp.]